jgi:hypothetical protein
MRRIQHSRGLIGIMAALGLLCGCASPRVTVELPPRVDLAAYGPVGLVGTRSAEAEPLPSSTSHQLLQAIQSAQPGIPVLELGSEDDVLRDLRRDRLDRAAIRALGESFGVDVLLVSDLQVTEIRPKLRLGESLKSVRAHAEIQATLGTRLVDTSTGATLWTRRSTAKADVARVGISSPGRPKIRVDDLESTRQRLVRAVVQEVTADFRPTYERR